MKIGDIPFRDTSDMLFLGIFSEIYKIPVKYLFFARPEWKIYRQKIGKKNIRLFYMVFVSDTNCCTVV